MLWGVHSVNMREVRIFEVVVDKSKLVALRHKVAQAGDRVILMAGVPFGTPGSTNVLHIVGLTGDELKGYDGQVNVTERLSSGLIDRRSLQGQGSNGDRRYSHRQFRLDIRTLATRVLPCKASPQALACLCRPVLPVILHKSPLTT